MSATPLHIRLDPAVQRKIKVNAVTLGITQGEYLERLVQLHEDMRRETWDTKQFIAILRAHGLEPLME